jgi:hypothetical protein
MSPPGYSIGQSIDLSIRDYKGEGNKVRILISIDDTDEMKRDGIEVRGTGELAGMIAARIEERGWGRCEPVTRHQLLVHPDIPYTSHNSAMCFAAHIAAHRLQDITALAGDFLWAESAPGSDPGLCIVVPERVLMPGWLMSFAFMAKNVVLTKDEAYELAGALGIHLSEHGGTGDGVIGAMAGAGLRFSGNDGRFRGKLKFKSADNTLTVREICSRTIVEQVKSIKDGRVLDWEERVLLGEGPKAVLMNGLAVMLVESCTGDESCWWQTCSKSQVKAY